MPAKMYRWVLDFGPGDDKPSTHDTPGAAITKARKALVARKEWAQRFANDTVQDIENGMVALASTPDAGQTLRVCIDRYTNSYMTIRIRREELSPAEVTAVLNKRRANRKDRIRG